MMKKIITISLLALLGILSSKAQLITDGTLTPAQLVQNILVGSGVSVSNVTFKGILGPDTSSIGSFKGTTNIGLKSGVLLTTGTIYDKMGNGPQGPNNSPFGGIDNHRSGDSLLNTLISNTVKTFNATVLEFDFVPAADTVRFRYVFASEEYPEYVCSQFNDIFGFFISGANPSGGNYVSQNIALIPGTSLPVAINSVNPGVSGSMSLGGTCTSLAYASQYVDNTNGTTIQYDGFTKVLTALAPVNCGEKYHIKIAIADVGDGVYDSGVFLEAGSFSSKTIDVTSKITYSGSDTVLYEGCGQANIILSRGGKNLGAQDTMIVTITGSAINGTDFTPNITDTLLFPIGVDTIIIPVKAINDGNTEGVESLTIAIQPLTGSACLKSIKKSVTIYIMDHILKVIPMSDAKLCPGTSTTLTASASGGAVYNYSWSTGASTKSITVNPSVPTKYFVTIGDSCSATPVTDTVLVSVLTPTTLNVNAGNDTSMICVAKPVSIKATATGGTKPYTYSWSSGAGTTQTVTVQPSKTTTYTVIVKDSCGTQLAKDSVKITLPLYVAMNISAPNPEKVCPGKTVNLNVAATGGGGNYAYSWTTVTGTDQVANPKVAGTSLTVNGINKLVVKVQDLCGTILKDTVDVEIATGCEIKIPNVFSPNGDGKNDTFIIEHLDQFPNSRLVIYNRWGTKIYESADYKNDWTAPNVVDGTYYYVLYLSDGGKEFPGFITILRDK